MNNFHVRLALCAIIPLSLYAQDATWMGTSSNDLELGSNWSTMSVPTEIAIFDSKVLSVNLTPQVLAMGPDSLNLSNFSFPNQANFVFTIDGPYGLNFNGEGCGITGKNTNPTIIATNSNMSMPVSQITFSGNDTSIGNAKLFAIIESGATITGSGSVNDLAQVLFDGSGDSTSQSSSIVLDSSTASIYARNYGTITGAMVDTNNIGQVIFDGSGGMGASSAGTGFSQVTIQNNVIISADTAENQIVENQSHANNVSQILFDGSGGFSSAAAGTGESIVSIGGQAKVISTLTQGYVQSQGIGNNVAQIAFDGSGGTSYGAGGQGSSTVVIKDSALISATAPDFGYPGYYSSGTANDTAQILFSGNGGVSYGAAGKGSSSVTITDSAKLYALNTYYLAGGESEGNDYAQILFDGSGGTGYAAGGTGSLAVTINGNAQVTADNAQDSGFIYTESAYANDLAQILFDGTPGLNYAGGGKGFCSVSIGDNAKISANNAQVVENYEEYTNNVGQIVLDGSGGYSNAEAAGSGIEVVIQNQAALYATNTSTATIAGGYGNNGGQIIFDGSGGFQYDHFGKGSAQVALKDAVQVIAINDGSVFAQHGMSQVSINDVAQIMFNGSGGASAGSGSTGQGTGSCVVSVDDAVTIQATSSGRVGNPDTGISINNIAQILFDGSGGLNSYGGGKGNLQAAIQTEIPISAINSAGAVISNVASSVSSHIGQIVFDGSQGSTGMFPSEGNLNLTLGDGVSITATNSGSISTAGTAQGVGQIIFDGTTGSTGTGSCVVQFGKNNVISAINTSSGVVEGDQIAFHNTVLQGSAVVQAINEGGSVTHGVAFYGPSTTAENLKVELSDSSIFVDATVSPSFSIGSLSGDASSSAIFNQMTTIQTLSKSSNYFRGNISGTGGMKIVGSGQQIICGNNSYTGDTTVSSGKLTLLNSNIPGNLLVESGSAFSGVGTIHGLANINGMIKPGNSPGTMIFLSGLTLSSSATTLIEVDGTEASLLDVSGGNASLAGTLEIQQDLGVRVGNTFPIVTVSGGNVVGTFDDITSTGKFIPVVVYSSDEVTLTLQNSPATFAALLLAPDRILRNMETLKHVATRRENTIEDSDARNDRIAKSQRTKMPWEKNDKDKKLEKPWSVYIEPTGSFGHVKSRRNVIGNTFQTVGARAGADYIWSNDFTPTASWCYGLGFVTEYNHWWGQRHQKAGSFASDTAYASAYGTFSPKSTRELSLNVIGGGGYSWYSFDRNPLGSSSSLETKGSPGGGLADALFEVEYSFQHGRFARFPKGFRITPMAALQYTYAHINEYKEKGAGIFDLEVDEQTTMSLSSLLGCRMSYEFMSDSAIKVRPELMAQWQYQYLDSSIDTACSSLPVLGSSDFPLTIPGFARNSLVAGADIRIDMYDKYLVQLNYDLWYNQGGVINFFLLEFKTEF